MITHKNNEFWKCSHGVVGTTGAYCPKCKEEDYQLQPIMVKLLDRILSGITLIVILPLLAIVVGYAVIVGIINFMVPDENIRN